MSDPTIIEKTVAAAKKGQDAVKKQYNKLEEGVKKRSVFDILKDSAGIKDDTWINLQEQIRIILTIFGWACVVCFALFTVISFAMFFVGMVETGCIYGKNEIGLGEGGQMLKPFYSSILQYFYGSNGYGGVIRVIRNSILLDRYFQLAKILIIILAIAFLGFNYITGSAELKSKDVIAIILKLVFVSFITDARSINFHDTVIIKTLTETMEYIAMFFQKLILKASMETLGTSLSPSVTTFFTRNANLNNNGTLIVFDMMFVL